MDRLTLPINEVFGPTWQGEGPHAGRRCWFVRTGYCNLSCSWCDTPYTWDNRRFNLRAENPTTSIDDVVDRLDALGAMAGDMVVISGGEPLMWVDRVAQLAATARHEWHVETNGTIAPPYGWHHFITHTTVSPKIAQDDDPTARRIIPAVLREWVRLADMGLAAFKFVARYRADLSTIRDLATELRIDPATIWVMPEGTTAAKVLATQRDLAEAVLVEGWNFTTRLHTLIWDDEKGR